MKIPFYKYHGTGNDFIIIDNRKLFFPKKDATLIKKMCDRRFGIGADGLLLLEENEFADFTMVYFNADGKLGTMCGNGGRCIVHFANGLKIIDNTTTFEASDGLHQATIIKNCVRLKMNDVSKISMLKNAVFLNTGSPHHIEWVTNIKEYPVETVGRELRYKLYGEEGSNVNFVEELDANTFAVRTYERGVEAETLSCGTGVTAVALALFESGKTQSNSVKIKTGGGNLQVSFVKKEDIYTNIFLEGPATFVFKGEWL